ncbi:putative UDP-glucuronosyl/UDP-glucosyltransferase, UDP-glycosyltransferase family [Helianthus annuus]|uniref:Glycosyltransferase n=1 Tax=Helianthus annuus TaxID=4232 RepID=A0A9K3IJK4_HELAN|nr:putative UDP-glucuronosyl/UDP-glucosyltransferase, UDP-glycosyltransferase family [Helianthus annuus]KAJ0556197.1 putative UDP-glucuronosyl/UDP-glucosyltransferase, UDP-glycosyltransferase family [Helianthus annuus]KAJ0730813.1 putative UDP-glucuronosyl/UDP-glucosyltransferase, UDP-glycosyltransferase family [Helianthus annuus]KAJ0904186.1 putative UDP-glucuronosyl/UDP-glucosyltransferase, UDP-glycosyltransferase family [Helianthus annuus]KAJ0907426.1 putative UDP-glucuronosyl/UDP-glucosyltr
MSSSQKQPHVLVISYPAQGHVNPLLQFCKRLVAKGIKTTFATTLSFSKSVTFDKNNHLINLETFSDGFDDNGPDEIVPPEVFFPKLREVGPKSLSDLVLQLDRPNVIIYDGFLPWALDVAKRFRLMGVAFFTQTCAVNSIYYHVNRKLLTVPLTDSVVSVPGLPLLENYETPSFVHKYGLFPDVQDLVFNQFTNIDQADWVFFNSFYKLEEEVLDWMGKLWHVRTIGPSLPSIYLDKRLLDDKDYLVNILNPKGSECMNWLNGKPKSSVVYLSFGSMTQPNPEQMKEITCALTDCGFSFLLVVKSCEEDKQLFAKLVLKQGLVVPWCPQLQVLAHESIGCFVTHCGLNSVLEAIGLGVPMVAMPQWSDQTTNAKYVEDVWGVGVRARPDANGLVSSRVLGSCIREVMEGEKGLQMKKNVMKWRDLAKEAIGEGGSSDNNIDEFVAELKLMF